MRTVRRHVLDPLNREQVEQLRDVADALLTRIDPDGQLTALYRITTPGGDASGHQ